MDGMDNMDVMDTMGVLGGVIAGGDSLAKNHAIPEAECAHREHPVRGNGLSPPASSSN
jgi:hypothetical protein